MKNGRKIFIVGAGFSGRTIAREIGSRHVPGEVVAFLDDDREKIGTTLEGIPVLGPIEACAGILNTTFADEVLIAIPSATRKQLKNIYDALSRAHFSRIRLLPAVSQIVNDTAHLVQARDIDPQDLLGRNPVSIDLRESLSYVRGRRVLVTGAGGSIGSELCRPTGADGTARCRCSRRRR